MENIQNLLERAKPELLKAIAQYKVDYPATAGHVEEVLTCSTFVSEIPFGTLNTLDSICRSVNLDFKFNNPYPLFKDFTEVVS